MNENNSILEIRTSLEQLRLQKSKELKLLIDQLHVAYENIQPANMINRAINELKTAPEIKDLLLNASIAIAEDFLTKTAFVGFSKSTVRKTVGTALMLAVANAFIINTDTIKSMFLSLF